MCGILAISSKIPLSRKTIAEALDSLQRIKHRGPDGEGVLLINTNTGESKSLRTVDTPENVTCHFQELSEVPENKFNLLLGHRRLSIIDLSVNGHQPMLFDNVAITYNGEIYNYLEIREELKAKGYVFSTNTDTEVIIKAYLEWGDQCLNHFNGMWSFVLWDNKAKKLFISNDRFGVKPLYYSQFDNKTILVSEIKQYLDFSDFKKEFNNEYFEDFLETGSTALDIETPLKMVWRFPNAHYYYYHTANKFNANKFERYYSIYNINQTKWKKEDAIQTFRDIFFDAVKIRTRADVPYGVGLSGGLDSTSVLLGVKKMLGEKGSFEKPYTFSVVYPGKGADESVHIDEALKNFSSNSFKTNPLAEFNKKEFEKTVYHREILPSGTSFYAQYKISQLAKKNGVSVVLVGQGADEVFGGYHAHFFRYCRQLILQGKIATYFSLIKSYAVLKSIPAFNLHKMCFGDIKNTIKSKLGFAQHLTIKTKLLNELDKLHDFLKADFSLFQLPNYLLSDDRTSMAGSIETRHPFMDFRLVEFGYSLPDNFAISNNGWQKSIVREAMHELPDSIRWRKDKKGFTAPEQDIYNELIFGKNSNKQLSSKDYRKELIKIFKNKFE